MISNAIGRAYHHQVEQEKVEARENMIRWKDREHSYQVDLRKASHEAEDVRTKLTKAHAESSSIKGKIAKLQKIKESLTKELVGV